MQNNDIYNSMVQAIGPAYRDNQIVSHSHYRDPIDRSDARLAGNSRIWGDASPEVQSRAIDALIEASERAGLNRRQTAYVLAIARVESGFNPDAAAGTTSAHGLGQFIDRTAEHYGVTDSNRSDVAKQAEALVNHYLDNKKLSESRGQNESFIYKYHHDGPSKDYGGLAISHAEVIPYIDRYELFVKAHAQGRTDQLGQTNESVARDELPRTSLVKPLANNDGILTKGESGSDVKHVQELLNKFGYHDSHGNPVASDGDFGQKTKQAVQAFQRAHGLEDDGIIGAKTMEALKRAEQSPLLSSPSHPDHRLYQQALAGIENLPQNSFQNDLERQNAAATMVFEAKVSGIRQIDNVVLSNNGNGIFAIQGAMNDPAHHRIHIDKNQAAAEPIEKSTVQIQQEIQIPAQQPENEQRRVRMA